MPPSLNLNYYAEADQYSLCGNCKKPPVPTSIGDF